MDVLLTLGVVRVNDFINFHDTCNFFQLINWLHHHAVLILSVGVAWVYVVRCLFLFGIS